MKRISAVLCLSVLFFFGCSTGPSITGGDNGKINITFLQVNDVYEIAPIEGGKVGGIARVAQVKKELLAKNLNTYMIMAGDFLSPSVFNSLTFEGKRIRGRQMVEALNAAGLDFAGFGNHEFDISESELESRINESAFDWIASNSFHKKNNEIVPFVKRSANGTTTALPTYQIRSYRDADGTSVKIGFIGLNIPFNKAAYVSYTDPLAAAEQIYARIKDSCNAVVAITHMLEKDDLELARRLPGLALIIGGHEHDMRYKKTGSLLLTKAHANARSAYVINLEINTMTGRKKARASLKTLDQSVPLDPATEAVVNKWSNIAEKNYSSIGFDAKKIVRQKGDPLEARENLIRKSPTNFSRIIVNAMEEACPDAKIAIVNSGSIRLDDVLRPPISQYDILRTLPFGGSILEVDMKGSLLKEVLEAGRKNSGIGGFLHYSESVFYDAINQQWLFSKAPIANEQIFRVALTDFLLTGGEANLGFLNKTNPAITRLYPEQTSTSDPRADIRLAIIRYLERH